MRTRNRSEAMTSHFVAEEDELEATMQPNQLDQQIEKVLEKKEQPETVIEDSDQAAKLKQKQVESEEP